MTTTTALVRKHPQSISAIRARHDEAPIRARHDEAPIRARHDEAPIRARHDEARRRMPEVDVRINNAGFGDRVRSCGDS